MMMSIPATIVWHPALSPALLSVLVVMAFVLMLGGYLSVRPRGRYRVLLPVLRSLTLVLLLFLILQPARRRERIREKPPLVAVVVDVSASMTERLGTNDQSRSERALEYLESPSMKRLERDCRRRFFAVGDQAESASSKGDDLTFSAPNSRLIGGLNDIADRLRNENLAGVVLLTDGLDRSGGELVPAVFRVPIFMPSLERPVESDDTSRMDWMIADVSYPQRAIVGWAASIDVTIRRTDAGADAVLPVRFYSDAELIESRDLRFEARSRFERVRFEIKPDQVGTSYFTVEIEPDPEDDIRKDNNVFQFMIEVIDDEMRVLYLEGVPRWEFKFLKNALFREARFSLDAFVQAADGVFLTFDEATGMSAGGTSAPSLSSDTLADYKVLVLGELNATSVDAYAEDIESFVEAGGGLLILGGSKSFSRDGVSRHPVIQRLLAAVPESNGMMMDSRFQLNLTPEGHQHPALSGLTETVLIPPVLSLWKPARLHSLATALVTAADGAPLIAVRRYGRGRTAVILTDSLWRWRMAGQTVGGYRNQEQLYDRFYSQLLHWLAPSGKDLQGDAGFEMVASGHEFNLREPVRIGAVTGLSPGAVTELQCQVEGPEGTRIFTMTPTTLGPEFGVGNPIPGFAFTFRADTPGRYVAVSELPDASDRDRVEFLIFPPRDELTGAPLDRVWLAELAKKSEGRFSPISEWESLLNTLRGQPRRIVVTEEKPVWDYAIILLLITTLLAVEWFLRRRANLI